MADIKFDKEKTALFAAGLLIGKFGKEVLGSRKVRETFVEGTAAALRAKERIMDGVSSIQENAEDIYAEAKILNEEIEIEKEMEAEMEEFETIYEDLSEEEEDFDEDFVEEISYDIEPEDIVEDEI